MRCGVIPISRIPGRGTWKGQPVLYRREQVLRLLVGPQSLHVSAGQEKDAPLDPSGLEEKEKKGYQAKER